MEYYIKLDCTKNFNFGEYCDEFFFFDKKKMMKYGVFEQCHCIHHLCYVIVNKFNEFVLEKIIALISKV